MMEIAEIFFEILSLYCLAPDIKYVKPEQKALIGRNTGLRAFLLPNMIGVYGINSFMYAFASGIILIGVPYGKSVYDGVKTDCPLNFIGHDLKHFSLMIQIKNLDIIIYLYNKIISSKLPKIYKEMLVLFLWINIHELEISFVTDNYEDYYRKIWNREEPFISEFDDEFRKFDIITDTNDAKLLIQKYHPISNLNSYMKFMLYSYIFITCNYLDYNCSFTI